MADDTIPKEIDEAGKRLYDLLTSEMFAELRGHDPEWQSAVIADLTARYIAGHHPALRKQITALHFELVTMLIPLVELIQFGEGKHPGWADMPKEETDPDFREVE